MGGEGWEDGKGWGQAGVGTGHFCDTGWGGAAVLGKGLGPGKRGRGQEKGEGASSPLKKLQLFKGCLEVRGGFDCCTETLMAAFCSSPGSAPFSCPFIHPILSCPPSCVLTLEGTQLTHRVTPRASFPPANKEAAAGTDGAGPSGRIRIHHS